MLIAKGTGEKSKSWMNSLLEQNILKLGILRQHSTNPCEGNTHTLTQVPKSASKQALDRTVP